MEELKIIYKILKNEIDPAYYVRARRIAEEVHYIEPEKIIDTGCGRGFYLKLLSFLGSIKVIAGIDINDDYLELAKKITEGNNQILVKKGSIYSIPFEDNYFDLAICSEVLEHLTEESKGLDEIYRILKPGGTLLVTVPNKNFPILWDPLNWFLMKFFNTHIDKNIWWLAGIWADHERLYTVDELKKKIEEKFTVTETEEYIHWCWPFSHFLFYGIGKNIVEYMGAKEFDRFNFKKEKKLSNILAAIVALPSRLLDHILPSRSSVMIFLKAKKL